jgi:hypothetical protein
MKMQESPDYVILVRIMGLAQLLMAMVLCYVLLMRWIH